MSNERKGSEKIGENGATKKVRTYKKKRDGKGRKRWGQK